MTGGNSGHGNWLHWMGEMREKGVGMCRKLFGWGGKGGQAKFPKMGEI